MSGVKKALVAPLNWGLGHASRCIPLIHELAKRGIEIIVAGDYPSLSVIENELPQIRIIKVNSPTPKYHAGKFMWLSLLKFLPVFLFYVVNEHRWLKKNCNTEKYDLIISDNRYGMFHRRIYSIFIGHQIHINLPGPLRFLSFPVTLINRLAIQQFDACWIPDYEDRSKSLAGNLSRIKQKNNLYTYIGPLSRFSGINMPDKKATYQIVCILSGPEPQRTMLEKILISQLKKHPHIKSVIMRGLPQSGEKLPSLPGHIKSLNYASTNEMLNYVAAAEVIVCRAGYTSIMDLAALNKPAILVPTTGQPEQEYLAGYLKSKRKFVVYPQSKLNILEGLEKIKHHNYNSSITTSTFLPVLNEILGK